MVKCLIFDCDGTLVDSELLGHQALEIKLRDYGIRTSAQTLMEKYRGGKLADILSELEDEHSIRLNEHFIKDYRKLVAQLFEKELRACEGVSQFLDQNTLPVSVASNGPLEKINQALEVTNLKKYFKHHVYSAYDINSWKPHPGLFLYAAQKMGYLPMECLVVEDSLRGIEAGLAAGMHTVLFDPLEMHKGIQGVEKISEMDKLAEVISKCNLKGVTPVPNPSEGAKDNRSRIGQS